MASCKESDCESIELTAEIWGFTLGPHSCCTIADNSHYRHSSYNDEMKTVWLQIKKLKCVAHLLDHVPTCQTENLTTLSKLFTGEDISFSVILGKFAESIKNNLAEILHLCGKYLVIF